MSLSGSQVMLTQVTSFSSGRLCMNLMFWLSRMQLPGQVGEEVGRDPDLALHVGRAKRLAAPLGELELGERRADCVERDRLAARLLELLHLPPLERAVSDARTTMATAITCGSDRTGLRRVVRPACCARSAVVSLIANLRATACRRSGRRPRTSRPANTSETIQQTPSPGSPAAASPVTPSGYCR